MQLNFRVALRPCLLALGFLLLPAAVAAAPLRTALLPILRSPGLTASDARHLEEWLAVELAFRDDLELVPLARLEQGASGSRVDLVLGMLGEQPPAAPLAPVLQALLHGGNLAQLLLARAEPTANGGALHLLVFAGGSSAARVAAELRWKGPVDEVRPALEEAVRKWGRSGASGPVATARNWPKGGVAESAPKPPPQAEVAAPTEDPPRLAPPIPSQGDVPGHPAAVLAPPPTAIGVTAQARTNYYLDNDHNRIVTPTVVADGKLNENLSIAAHATLDIMTCASVDVVSAATPKGYFQETRQEVGGSATVSHDQLHVSVGASGSKENDYSSGTGTLAVSDEFASRNTTLSLAYGYTGSNVGRAHDPAFVRDLKSQTLTAAWSQVLGRDWIAQASLFVGVLNGFQSSVYRFVHFRNGGSGAEVVPDLRVREALAVEVRGALGARWFLAGNYRLYNDSWGILAHTAEAAISMTPTRRITLRLRDRFYQQSSSNFYRSAYTQPQRYMTIDRELGALFGNLAGLKFSIDLLEPGQTVALEFDVKFDGMWQHFEDFPWLTDRLMAMTEAGFLVTF